ncbi:MAG: ABC transporter ATP-binding protein [Acidobacteria bacterium]|nr:ABC transporter ATP-binding protein [Acidobacteriota bacterium]
MGLAALILVDGINVGLPLMVREAIDGIPEKNVPRVLWAGAGFLFLMVCQSGLRYVWRMYLMGTSHRIARGLRLDLYNHLQNLPLARYQTIRTGDLMSRATNDIQAIREAVGPGVLITVDAIISFLIFVPVMLYLSVKLTILALLFAPLVPWITTTVGDRIDRLFESMQVKMSNISAFTQETFGGIRLIKSLVLENRVRQRFFDLSEEYQEEGIRMASCEARFTPSLTVLTHLGLFMILIVGGMDVINGAITVGTFVAFQRFVVQLSWPMEAIGWAVTMSREGVAAHRRLQQILGIPQVTSVRTPAVERKEAPLLEINHLHHAYESNGDGDHFGLKLSHLKVHEGQKIGVVGPVGAGKSTLFNLIVRLYEPPEETVFFEGKDVASIPLVELRRKISTVEQQVFLFSEKVTTNIELGMPGSVDGQEARKVIRTVCMEDEIEELHDKYDTYLGERGVNLSGGQKQRLALARALIRKPRLLLLDDAFSAVDVEIERRILRNLLTEYPDLTLIFASHRLSIMPSLDEIWILDKGKLVAKGHHQQLLQSVSLYGALWQTSERSLESRKDSLEADSIL